MKGVLIIEARVKDGGCPFSYKQFYEPCTVRKIITDLEYTDGLSTHFVEKMRVEIFISYFSASGKALILGPKILPRGRTDISTDVRPET